MQGEFYKLSEIAKPRIDGMCLKINDVDDIINGKGVYVVAPPFYNKVTLLNLRSKIFKHPTYLGKALLRSKVKAQFSVIKGGGLLPGWVKLPVRVIGGASPPRTPPQY